MEHVLFYEPRFEPSKYDIWRIRGGYKYPSILGDLAQRARVSILMSRLPPPSDPHRRALEDVYGVSFRALTSVDIAHPEFSDELTGDLVSAIEACGPTTISNLNGRGTGFHFAMARAARVAGVRYVQRVAGDDVVARASVLMHRNEHFWGTQSYIAAVEQERVAAEIAQRIIVMNQRERTRVAAHCDDPSKVHVCFRGADQTHFFPEDHPKLSCRKFLFVGRQSFEKGYDILESAASLLEKSDLPISISFAGTFTPAQTGLRRYLGFVELKDLPELYRSHDALVVCSRSEGFPQVIAEAMSCGLPCILSRNLFRQEFIQRDNCLLVDATPEDVAAGILELHTDANLYRRLQDGTVAYAKRFFSEVRNRRDYHELILE